MAKAGRGRAPLARPGAARKALALILRHDPRRDILLLVASKRILLQKAPTHTGSRT